MVDNNITFGNHRRSGFTLVELLLVIAIMGVLTTMALAFMRSANEQARVSATQARIKKIEAILNAELERYEVRRLPISRDDMSQVVQANLISANPSSRNPQLNNLRRRLIQDLINVELPRPVLNGGVFERNPDLGQFPSNEPPLTGTIGFRDWLNSNYSNPNPGLGNYLATQLGPRASGAIASWGDPSLNDDPPNNRYFDLPGEYLYQILKRIDFDGVPALESLGSSAFGDSDEDGFLEVVDAWGEPLLWLIVQVKASDPPPTPEDYKDEDRSQIDWTQRDSDGMPKGYTLLDPRIPRDLQQVRITVYSKRLNEQGIYNTD